MLIITDALTNQATTAEYLLKFYCFVGCPDEDWARSFKNEWQKFLGKKLFRLWGAPFGLRVELLFRYIN